MEAYLTPEEVAETLQIKKKTVYDWIRRGKLRGSKLGRLWRVRGIDVEKLVREGWIAEELEFRLVAATTDRPDANEESRRQFLDEANAAFAEWRDDAKAWQEEQEERKLWDSTNGDGISGTAQRVAAERVTA